MRIAVDARELCGRPTGVGRYLASLLRAWAGSSEAARHDWQLFAPASVAVPSGLPAAVDVLPGAGGTAWEQGTLAAAIRRHRPDVLFAPGYSAPLATTTPTLLTVHDVSFAAHPEYFQWREGLRRRVVTRLSAWKARLVVTDSTFSAAEITQHLHVPASRVRVVPLGIDPPAASMPDRPRAPVVLYVGSLFARRHVDALVTAFVSTVAPAVPEARLEIVGENRLFPPVDPQRWLDTAPPDVRARVRFRHYVDEPTLAALYAEASVFVFLSDYEGFGLTPLEALAAGVPSVVLDTPVSREVYGAAAVTVPAADDLPGAVGHAVRRLLTDPRARHEVLRHAADVLGRYRWTTAATSTLTLLDEVAGG